MRPLVIDYLKTHTFRQLEEEHGVNSRPNAGGDKFGLNYDQIMSRPSNPLANQCRGLIVRPVTRLSKEGWEDQIVGDVSILGWPMHRFFNLGDSNAAVVDWNDPKVRIYDKLDGTCCTLYWDKLAGRWHVATRSVPEADLPIKGDHIVIGNMTFSELFDRTFRETWNLINPYDQLRREWTYVFELTSPYNKIVVKYEKPGVTLLAIRNNDTGEEIDVSGPIINEPLGLPWVPRPKVWPIGNALGLVAFLDLQDPTKCEGAVVCDSNFNRVKIKSAAYLLSFRMKDMLSLSRRSVLEAVLAGHMDDVLPQLDPDLAAHVLDLQDKVRTYFATVDKNFHIWKAQAGGNQKAFAILVQTSDDWHVPYYSMLKGSHATCAAWAADAVGRGKLSQSTLEYLVNKLKWFPKVD
jgi:hypothetical protein